MTNEDKEIIREAKDIIAKLRDKSQNTDSVEISVKELSEICDSISKLIWLIVSW